MPARYCLRVSRRYRSWLQVAGVLLLLLTVLIYRHDARRDHHLQPESVKHAIEARAGTIAITEISQVCRQHGFSPFNGPRRIYDLIMFSTELDWLEIRLHTLAKHVDYFVIIESPTTFTGNAKPLTLKEHWNDFSEFHHQIIYRQINDMVNSTRIWDHEDYLRNSLLTEALASATSRDSEPREDDVLLVSDMDEILRPETLFLLRHCHFPDRLTLRTDFYYYSFLWRHTGPQWPHPDVTTFSSSHTLRPNDLRMNLLPPTTSVLSVPYQAFHRWYDRATLWNAGWHCSSCFATVEEFRVKMGSFSHQGWNTEVNRNAGTIRERVKNGQDLFGREGEVFERVEGNEDVMPYLLEQWKSKGRFGWLMGEGLKKGHEGKG